MNSRTASLIVAMLVGLVIGLLLANTKQVVGQGGGNGTATSFAQHHKEITMTVSPDTLIPINLPVTDQAVSVVVTISGVKVFGPDVFTPRPAIFQGFCVKDSLTGKTINYTGVGFGNGFFQINTIVDPADTQSLTGLIFTNAGGVPLSNGTATISFWY
jgi:hypothetical protein